MLDCGGERQMTDKPSRFSHAPEQTGFARRLRREVSKTERRLWPHLRSSKMNAPFRRQHPIDRYFADYCCVPLKLVIEIDGHTHSLDRDAKRNQRMTELGFDILRFSVQEIDENLDGVINTIHAAVQLRLQHLEALKQTPT
jgi:very-short-patch-repair endonuclease